MCIHVKTSGQWSPILSGHMNIPLQRWTYKGAFSLRHFVYKPGSNNKREQRVVWQARDETQARCYPTLLCCHLSA